MLYESLNVANNQTDRRHIYETVRTPDGKYAPELGYMLTSVWPLF